MLKSTMDALMKMQQEEDDDKGRELMIEEQRAKLDADKCTRVTKETFEAWHKKRREKRMKMKKEKDIEDQVKAKGKGSKVVFLSGRALMKFDAKMFANDEEDDDDEEEKYERKDQEEGDEDILELKFGLEDEEEELKKEIQAAKNMNIDSDLFNEEEADDVDLDDLE